VACTVLSSSAVFILALLDNLICMFHVFRFLVGNRVVTVMTVYFCKLQGVLLLEVVCDSDVIWLHLRIL
jgi:hypothetical protein